MPSHVDPQHTPGTWLIDGEDRFARVVSEAGWTIAESHHALMADPDDAEAMHMANMRLIAASPQMLAALKLARKAMTNERYGKPRIDMEAEWEYVDRAIALAERMPA